MNRYRCPAARWTLAFAVLVGFAGSAPSVGAGELKPLNVERFFVLPGVESSLRWRSSESAANMSLDYVILDYGGKNVGSGRAASAADGSIETNVRLDPGYYEIEFASTGQRFGVASLANLSGERDPFFAIDAAMSWLVSDRSVREGLIRSLNRCGIGMSRERLAWSAVSPKPGVHEWDGTPQYETLRRTYAQQRVEVLEMFHDAPRWLGTVGKYPADLVAASQQWEEIGKRWRPTWGAAEVWNEPDIFFGGLLPADQYVPLVKTIAYAFQRSKVDVPLVGGVFAHFEPDYLDTAASNGLLDTIDVLSFHTYGRAPEMEALVLKYWNYLRSHDREAMPLWITECGRPWRKGPSRPPREQDAESALDIAMKAVEARACGIARFFAFVYPFYDENDNNFGMMGREATPLRSMAAYAQLVRCLSHKGYRGDLKTGLERVTRARVFGDPSSTVAVLYTGKSDPAAELPLDLPFTRVEGIDGRSLTPTRAGQVPIPDGLTYVWLDHEKLGQSLILDTRAMQLCRSAQQAASPRPAASPIVLRLEVDSARLKPEVKGYRLTADPTAALPARIRVFNLDTRPHDVTLRSAGTIRVTGSVSQEVDVPTGGFVDTNWELDLRSSFSDQGVAILTVSATADHGDPILPLQARFLAPAQPKPERR